MKVIYTAGLVSHAGHVYDITIETEDYYNAAPQAVALTTEEPVVIERRQEALFDPVCATSVTLRLLLDDTSIVKRISLDELRAFVRVKESGNTLFVGPIEVGLHQEDYDQAPYVVELVAGCGLMKMQDFPPYFSPSDEAKPLPLTLDALIRSCLSVAGSHVQNTPIYRTKLESLSGLYIDARRWLYDEAGRRTDETAFDLLTSVLSSLNMRIYQDNERWVIDRPADLVSLSPAPVILDTDILYFTSPAVCSSTQPCGSMALNLSTDTDNNLLRYRLAPGSLSQEWRYNMPYYEWRRYEKGSGFHVQTERQEGMDIRVSSSTAKPLSVVFRSRFPFNDLLSPRTALSGNKLSISLNFEGSALNSLTSEHVAYLSCRVVLLSNSTNIKYIASRGTYLSEEKELRFNPVELIGTDALDNAGMFDKSKVPFFSPFIESLSEFPQTVNFDILFPYDTEWWKKVDGIGIAISPVVWEGKKDKAHPNFPIPSSLESYKFARLGSLSIEQEGIASEEGVLTLQVAGKNARKAEDMDIRLRPYCPYVQVQPGTRYALYRDPEMWNLCKSLSIDNKAYTIEELAARDRLLHFSQARITIAGQLNNTLLYSPAQLYEMSTDRGKQLLATYVSSNLLEDSSEVELQQIINPEHPTYKWQL